jgi:hypothetical protein
METLFYSPEWLTGKKMNKLKKADIRRLENLPSSNRAIMRKVWIHYDGRNFPSYEIQELDKEGKILNHKNMSPEELHERVELSDFCAIGYI